VLLEELREEGGVKRGLNGHSSSEREAGRKTSLQTLSCSDDDVDKGHSIRALAIFGSGENENQS